MKDYQFLQRKYVVPSYANRGLTLVRGEGMYLLDEGGNKYLDLMSNYGVNIFGYNNSQINEAIIKQLKKLSSLHGSFINDIRAQASEKLVKKCGLNYNKVYWSNSGAEAVETALKFAIFATGKKKFVSASNSYHGKTLAALSATGMRKYQKELTPLLWDFTFVKYNDISQLKRVVDRKTAAVILEPIQGESGVILPDKEYLQKVEELCKASGSLLILDEIQTGVGRTGQFLASHAGGVEADIVCLGKGLAGGLPVGATVMTEKISKSVPKYSHSSTLGGNPLVCAAVLAVLENLNGKVLLNVGKMGSYFMNQLSEMKTELIVEIRGRGLMIAIQVNKDRDRILKDLQINKILAIPAGDDVIRFLPPYIISKKHVDIVIEELRNILK